jgi:hypothetical protein
VPDQRDPFYKPIPESHEQARNIVADCKTQIAGMTLFKKIFAA